MTATLRTVLVIGGGAAGCASALALAKSGWQVHLFEKHTLFSGTSSKTAGRLGLGFHYIDLQTAVMLLQATIRFTKTFPGFRLGETLPWPHHLRHGRYFITKNSVASPAKILFVYESLKNIYEKMVKEDPSNMVFGPPEGFYRILEPKEYENDVDVNKIALGVETAEHLLDWKKYEKHVVRLVKSHENIFLHEHTELVDVKRAESDKQYRFILNFKCAKKMETICCDYVVNSTWHEIEKLNDLAGFPQHSVSRTNRLKALLHVRLPNSMIDCHSMFFCIGPFCMLSNLGDGTAYITYAPVTNVSMSTEVTISKEMSRLLSQGPSEQEFCMISQGILRGATSFIPGLENAEAISINFGIVQTHGSVDLQDVNSAVHKRAYFGVRSEGDGWISNPCMKLLYMLENGDIVADMLDEQFYQDSRLNFCL